MIREHFDTHPETGRAMLPPAEVEQCDHDTPPAWLPGIGLLALAFWIVVGVWVVL